MDDILQSIIYELRQRFVKSEHEFYGYEDYENSIIPSIKNAYLHGDSNSLIIIGKRGSGKTHLIKNLLINLNRDENFAQNMYVVRLNGLLHTDDKNALVAIASQLKLQLPDDDSDEFSSDNFLKTFEFILSFLKSGDRQSISLLFIIEEFDHFLNHKNQMLIYNLFNCIQSKGTPIFVLGTTLRSDYIEMMEKRVKSRFSHFQVGLFPYAASFDLYVDAARKLLTMPIDDKSSEKIVKRWNKMVKDFLDDPVVLKLFEQMYLVNNTISVLKRLLIPSVSGLSVSDMKLSVASLEFSRRMISLDTRSEVLKGLCLLEFTFLAVMVKCAVYRVDINFEMIYKEYQEFCGVPTNNCMAYDKNVLRKCLDNLIELALVCIKKAANVNANYYPLLINVTSVDMRECIKKKSVPAPLQNYINAKLNL